MPIPMPGIDMYAEPNARILEAVQTKDLEGVIAQASEVDGKGRLEALLLAIKLQWLEPVGFLLPETDQDPQRLETYERDWARLFRELLAKPPLPAYATLKTLCQKKRDRWFLAWEKALEAEQTDLAHTIWVHDLTKLARPDEYDRAFQVFIRAAQAGRLATVRYLAEKVPPDYKDSEALLQAATAGQARVVEFLLPLSQPKAADSVALRMAVRQNHEVIALMLLPHSDPSAKSQEAFQTAVSQGMVQLTQAMLERVDVRAKGSQALRTAALAGNVDLISLLWPHSDTGIVAQVFLKSQKWNALDQLGPFAAPDAQTHWLNAAPPGALPQTLANARARQMPTGTPSHRPRPRS